MTNIQKNFLFKALENFFIAWKQELCTSSLNASLTRTFNYLTIFFAALVLYSSVTFLTIVFNLSSGNSKIFSSFLTVSNFPFHRDQLTLFCYNILKVFWRSTYPSSANKILWRLCWRADVSITSAQSWHPRNVTDNLLRYTTESVFVSSKISHKSFGKVFYTHSMNCLQIEQRIG